MSRIKVNTTSGNFKIKNLEGKFKRFSGDFGYTNKNGNIYRVTEISDNKSYAENSTYKLPQIRAINKKDFLNKLKLRVSDMKKLLNKITKKDRKSVV